MQSILAVTLTPLIFLCVTVGASTLVFGWDQVTVWLADMSGVWMPHVQCIRRNPYISSGEVLGNMMFLVAYVQIPRALARLVREFSGQVAPAGIWAATGFRRFIQLCGMDHGVSIVMMFWGAYQVKAASLLIGGWFSMVFAARFADLVEHVVTHQKSRRAFERFLRSIAEANLPEVPGA